MLKTIAVLICCASWSFACPKGSTEWKGSCAVDLKPQGQAGDSSRWTTDEKPSRHPEPAWQRGDVKIIEIHAFTTDAEEADAQIKFAELHSTGRPSGLGK